MKEDLLSGGRELVLSEQGLPSEKPRWVTVRPTFKLGLGWSLVVQGELLLLEPGFLSALLPLSFPLLLLSQDGGHQLQWPSLLQSRSASSPEDVATHHSGCPLTFMPLIQRCPLSFHVGEN